MTNENSNGRNFPSLVGASAAQAGGRGRRMALSRVAAALMVLLPVAAVAQTPADIARLSGAPAAASAVSVARPAPAGAATAADLVRLMAVVPGAANAAREAAAGSFTAADLARLGSGGSLWRGGSGDFSALTASR